MERGAVLGSPRGRRGRVHVPDVRLRDHERPAPARGVHVGRDGWLFLTGGTNAVVRQYRRSPRRWLRLRGWSRLIERRGARAGAAGIRYLHAVIPDKLSIYADRCRGDIVDPSRSQARMLAALLARRGRSDLLLDLVPPMLAARDAEPLFWRTDTHWTPAGCLLAAREICRALGAALPDDLLERPYSEAERPLDLGSKLDPPAFELHRSYGWQRDAGRSYANDLMLQHEAGRSAVTPHTAAHVVFDNGSPSADPRRLLVYGDSFAHYEPYHLTGILAETFRQVHYVWSTSLDWRHVERVAPDILLTEIAERFLTRVPDDRWDVAAEAERRLAVRVES